MLYQLLVSFACCVWYLETAVACDHIKFGHLSSALQQPIATDFRRGFKDLLQRMQMESYFVNIFLLRNQPADCVDEQLPLNFNLPFLQVDANNPVYVRGNSNTVLLAILCVRRLTDKEFLIKFAKDLQHIRKRRILVIHNRNFNASAHSDIVTFFQRCEQFKFLNTMLIHRDFANTQLYHSFNQFPEFVLETRSLSGDDAPIYPNRFVNVGRKKLRILVDQFEPMTMLYNKGDNLIIDGYIGFFLKTFARQYNFQLYLPDGYESTAERVLYMEEIRQATRNGSIDVGASLLTPQKELNLHGYIYPIEFFQWLTMLPVEPPLETYYLFIKIFGPRVIISLIVIVWCLCVVNAIQKKLARGRLECSREFFLFLMIPWELDLLRGLVCQSTALRCNNATRRIIFVLIFALGGTLNSFFSTKLVNWWTVPPKQAPIVQFSQLAERNLQIQVAEPDIADIKFYRGEKFWINYKHIFNIVKGFDEYQNNIRKLDARYGYVMTTMTWPIIEQRQKYFAQPLFRLSSSLYFTKGALLSLPVSENSLYRDLLSDFCLRSQQSGLLSHWYKKTFFAMVRLKRFNLKDPTNKHIHSVLTLKSLEWVWIAYCVGIMLSGLVFSLEIAWCAYLRRVCVEKV